MGGDTQGYEYQEVEIIGPILEAAYHRRIQIDGSGKNALVTWKLGRLWLTGGQPK